MRLSFIIIGRTGEFSKTEDLCMDCVFLE